MKKSKNSDEIEVKLIFKKAYWKKLLSMCPNHKEFTEHYNIDQYRSDERRNGLLVLHLMYCHLAKFDCKRLYYPKMKTVRKKVDAYVQALDFDRKTRKQMGVANLEWENIKKQFGFLADKHTDWKRTKGQWTPLADSKS